MRVFVINEDQVKQYILISVAVIIVVFLSGYFIGAQTISVTGKSDQSEAAENIKTPVSDEKLVKPEPILTASKDTPPEVDGKKLQNQKIANKKVKPEKTTKKKPEVRKQVKSPEKNRNIKKVVTSKTIKKKEILKNKPEKSNLQQKNITALSATNQQLSTAGQINKPITAAKKYSIQAGMFASKVNADSFIKKLAEKQFDAYISDFESSSGAIKYNVRVGSFESRDQARQLLKEFQKSFFSPAYVVITN